MRQQGTATPVRYDVRKKIGDTNTAYEFNVKYHFRVRSSANNGQWDAEVDMAVQSFADKLRKRYAWIGDVYLTGRSAGWLTIVDRDGKARLSTIQTIASEVRIAWIKFRKHMEKTYSDKEES